MAGAGDATGGNSRGNAEDELAKVQTSGCPGCPAQGKTSLWAESKQCGLIGCVVGRPGCQERLKELDGRGGWEGWQGGGGMTGVISI